MRFPALIKLLLGAFLVAEAFFGGLLADEAADCFVKPIALAGLLEFSFFGDDEGAAFLEQGIELSLQLFAFLNLFGQVSLTVLLVHFADVFRKLLFFNVSQLQLVIS